MERVEVWRGDHGDPVPLVGRPLPGIRDGDTPADEFRLPPSFEPWPGRTRLERVFVVLDLGVGLAEPCRRRRRTADGRTVPGVDGDLPAPATWYVDLLHVTLERDRIVLRDLYLDVLVPTDGRHQRPLDLDEFADGHLDPATAVDGMRRRHRFHERHLHTPRFPSLTRTDFPPRRLSALAALPAPLGPVVEVTD
ncbi:DUF402 domain-containing protein [Amycolatopsis rhabdoformis]|uniref:DUF402 domain-containing protein n=1 Tax=Amycolatopsis rhabdoformis TaxID=1448059 RepID=A0ABZ1IK72_9PSEU|nr:DUF402 domain-containing protein [Amycolatopsis rhabdoformis]WSE34158.1 DUF402 domain-containing protein [Amycolatopsis rhabdoformis]